MDKGARNFVDGQYQVGRYCDPRGTGFSIPQSWIRVAHTIAPTLIHRSPCHSYDAYLALPAPIRSQPFSRKYCLAVPESQVMHWWQAGQRSGNGCELACISAVAPLYLYLRSIRLSLVDLSRVEWRASSTFNLFSCFRTGLFVVVCGFTASLGKR